jgi:hypothetical protein
MKTTRKVDDEIDLDDGPVLTTDRLRLAALPPPLHRMPPPPPPSRRARGTAPLGEPVPSGLIDVRAMAAAYQAERPPPALPPLPLAEGTAPLDLIEAEPTRADRTQLPVRRIALAVAIAATAGGAAVFAASRIDRDVRPQTIATAEFEAPPLILRRADRVAVPTEDRPVMRVVALPTTVTELAAPEPVELEQPRVRRALPDRETAGVTGAPMRPTNSEIASAVVAAHRQLVACGARHAMSGAVPVTLRVAPSGAVASVTVGEGTVSFRNCLASALRRQRLPASQVGTTARFPVIVR